MFRAELDRAGSQAAGRSDDGGEVGAASAAPGRASAGPGDRELYARLFHLETSLAQITPLYFEAPLAPPIAAQREGRQIDLALVWQALSALCSQHNLVLVEALGGLGSPVTYEVTVADLARDWRLPVVLVVPVRLGAIAQAVANVALARESHLQLQGIILNCVGPCSDQDIADWAPAALIESLTHAPVLGCLPYLADPTDLTQLAQAASDLDVERLIPVYGG